ALEMEGHRNAGSTTALTLGLEFLGLIMFLYLANAVSETSAAILAPVFFWAAVVGSAAFASVVVEPGRWDSCTDVQARCPECGAEYRAGYTLCTECRVPLDVV